MKKIIPVFLISLFTVTLHAQQDTLKNDGLSDSVCLQKAKTIIQQMRGDTVKPKFHYDDNFLIALVRKLSPPKKTAIRILNLGGTYDISFSILESKVVAYDSSGKAFDITITSPVELLKGQSISHCESASINLSDYKFANYVSCDIQQVKIKLVFGGKEIIAVIGREL
jgi:hypothetical protein